MTSKALTATVQSNSDYVLVVIEGNDPCLRETEAHQALGIAEVHTQRAKPPGKKVIVDIRKLVPPADSAGLEDDLADVPDYYEAVGAKVRFVFTSARFKKFFKNRDVPDSMIHADVESALASFGVRKAEDDLAGVVESRRKQQADSDAQTAARAAEFEDPGPLRLPAVGTAGWATAVRKKIGSLREHRGAIRKLCREVLAKPAAVAQKEWPQLVKDVIAASMTFTELSRTTWGKPIPISKIDEDESGVVEMIADDHLYTWDWALEVLTTPAAIGHPKWAELVHHLAQAKWKAVAHYSFAENEVMALVGRKEAQAHPQFKKIERALKKSFPSAGW